MNQFESGPTTIFQPEPYGPSPQRRRRERTTLVAVMAAMVLAVAAGAVIRIHLSGSDPAAETVVGDGYSYVPPAGWAQVTPPDGSVDTLASGGTAETILVSVEPAGGVLETPTELWMLYSGSRLESSDELPAIPRGPRLDGEPTMKGRTGLGSSPPSGTSRPFYVAEHDGRLYTIIVFAPLGGAAEADAVLRDVAASWSWH